MGKKTESKPAKKPESVPAPGPDNRMRRAAVLMIVIVLGSALLLGSLLLNASLPAAVPGTGSGAAMTGSARLAAIPVSGSPAGVNNFLNATFVYANGCSHCEKVKRLIADLQARYPELRIVMLEINDNKTNREHFLAMLPRYGLGTAFSVPTVFIGENALVGETEIEDHFEEMILAEKSASLPVLRPNRHPPHLPLFPPAAMSQSMLFFSTATGAAIVKR